MKAAKFSEAQIAFVLKWADEGTASAEVCRKAGDRSLNRRRGARLAVGPAGVSAGLGSHQTPA